MPDLDRRDFLKLVGAGAGAAASAACSDPVENLIPYVVQPEEVTPGIPVVYASTCRECPAACGLHVTTREGRPIKLEGNPEHPINQGKLCARGQAGIGRTYHPDRYEGPVSRAADGTATAISWDDGVAKLGEMLRASRGKVAVLGASRGPTIDGVIDAVVAGAGGKRVVYQPFGNEALRAATKAVFGVAALPIVDVSGADLVLDFGSDFLDSWVSPTEHSGQFADAQDLGKHENGGARLVSISPRMSLTASNADQWIPAAPGSEGALALALARAVHGAARVSVEAGIESALAKADIAGAVAAAGIERSAFDALVQRLASAKAAVALPPGVAATGTRAVAANAAVLVLDAVLGAIGTRIVVPTEADAQPAAGLAEIEALVADMRAGRVDVLLVHDSNPVYSLPASVGFADALAQVKLVVAFAPLADETSERAGLSLPDHTPLESWGDAAPRAGVRSLVQPTIRPLWDTRAIGDTLLSAGRAAGFAGLPDGDTRSLVEAAWSGSNFRAALSRGGEFGAAPKGAPSAAGGAAGLDYAPAAIEGKGDLMLVAYPHSMLADGSGAALPWLQEIPDPVMKLAWWSWAEVSKATGKKLGPEARAAPRGRSPRLRSRAPLRTV